MEAVASPGLPPGIYFRLLLIGYFEGIHYGTQYDLSPDGRRIYFLDRRVDDAPHDVGIVIGWRALLEVPR